MSDTDQGTTPTPDRRSSTNRGRRAADNPSRNRRIANFAGQYGFPAALLVFVLQGQDDIKARVETQAANLLSIQQSIDRFKDRAADLNSKLEDWQDDIQRRLGVCEEAMRAITMNQTGHDSQINAIRNDLNDVHLKLATSASKGGK